MIHLDTSFLIRALVRATREDRTLREWLRTGEPLGMSTLAWSEFLCGPVKEEHTEIASAIVPVRVPFAEADAVLSAQLFNISGRRRGSMVDCMIAASAIHAEADLATANLDDFRRLQVSGLQLARTVGE